MLKIFHSRRGDHRQIIPTSCYRFFEGRAIPESVYIYELSSSLSGGIRISLNDLYTYGVFPWWDLYYSYACPAQQFITVGENLDDLYVL